MSLERLYSPVVHTVIHILSSEIMHVAVVIGTLLNGQLEERKITAPRLARIGIMIELHAHGIRLQRLAALILQYFMDGMHPSEAATRMRLAYPEYIAFAAVVRKAPKYICT